MTQLNSQQSNGEALWTCVSSKRNRQTGVKKATTPANHATSTMMHSNQAKRTDQLSVSEIQSDHARFSQQWTTSASCRQLKGVLMSRTCQPTPSKAICFGLGSFDPEDGSWHVKRRSHVQLAAFMTLVECLNKEAEHKIRCIFQEPCFTRADADFLRGLGHEVVDSPFGFDQVADDTVVYGIHLYRDIYAAIIEKTVPAIFVGTGYDIWESCGDTEVHNWARMKQLNESCEKVKFPDDGDFYPAFTSTTIHWRHFATEGLDDLTAAVEDLSLERPRGETYT
ncbi:hypothetical protein BJ170DRAFT_681842 [Xylariales sp. AK1849]|nr:hypothetical protein BJ170DRAFT_681842 [Xylariales sp. AK1849]